MSSSVAVRISDSLHLHIAEVAGSHRLSIIGEEGAVVASIEVNDLQRLLKRPGTIVAAAPVELRNDQRQIVVRFRGRIIGQVEKHQIVAALP